jgi:hypothetical protein
MAAESRALWELGQLDDLGLRLGGADAELRHMLYREALEWRVLRQKLLNLGRPVVDLLKIRKLGCAERNSPLNPNRHDLYGMGTTDGLDASFGHDCSFFQYQLG